MLGRRAWPGRPHLLGMVWGEALLLQFAEYNSRRSPRFFQAAKAYRTGQVGTAAQEGRGVVSW